MMAPEITLEPARLIALAESATGLNDWGAVAFRPALDTLCSALQDEARLNQTGRATHSMRLQDLLATRLQLQQFVKNHPDVLGERIRSPVVIIGLPRTGTTMLQRMIAADPAFYSSQWWETRFPLPLAGEYSEDDVRARIERAKAEVAMMLELVPELAAIHPLSATEADEEIMLLEHSLISTTPEAQARVPSYARWHSAQDQRPAYRHLKTLLQCLQWQKKRRGIRAERWVLKTPHHLHCLQALLDVFPDAFIVQTHRDPLDTIPSMASFCHALYRLGSDDVDPVYVGQHWSARMRGGLDNCMAVRGAEQEPRFIDIDFADTVRDPIDCVRRIFAFVEQPFRESTLSSISAWTEANRRDSRPTHHYSAEQFGLSATQLAEDFRAYRERFIR